MPWKKSVGIVIATGLMGACAHTPPPPDPCAGFDDVNAEPISSYPSSQWIVGTGRVSGTLTSAEADDKARAAAANTIASQILVRVQSQLEVYERESSRESDSISITQQKIQVSVDDLQLPGLRQIRTCYSPGTLTTAALAVLNRREAQSSAGKLLEEQARTMDEQLTQLNAETRAKSWLAAIARIPELEQLGKRYQTQLAVATALGATATPATSARDLDLALKDLRTKKTFSVERRGEASDPAFEPLAYEAGRVATELGWRSASSGNTAIRIELSLGECSDQAMGSIGGVKVRCPASFSVIDTRTGATVRTTTTQYLEAAGRTRSIALGVAVKKNASAFGKALREAVGALSAKAP